MNLDIAVIVIYLVLVNGVALFFRGSSSLEEYFNGNRAIHWVPAALSIVATETSTLTFISIPGLAYFKGIGFIQIALGYITGRILVAIFLVGPYFRGRLSTVYQYLQSGESGDVVRKTVSGIFIVTRLLADGVRLFATAIPLAMLVQVDYWQAILIISLATFLYTFYGGIRAVIVADSLQMVVYMAAAGAVIALLGSTFDGGLAGLLSNVPSDLLQGVTLGGPDGMFSGYTLVTGLVGGAFLSFASHGTDQLLVQRLLSCADEGQARKAVVASGLVVAFQFALFLFLGLLIYGYLGGIHFNRPDEVMPWFVVHHLPAGLRGLVLAGVFAAAMSSLSSTINALSSSTVYDFLQQRVAIMDQGKQVLFSRMTALLWTVVLTVFAMVMKFTTGSLVEIGLGIASVTYGPVLAVFLMKLKGVSLSPRVTVTGIVTGLVVVILISRLTPLYWTWYIPMGMVVTLTWALGLRRFS